MRAYGRRWRAWLAGVALGLLPGIACAGGAFPASYDEPIRKAWEMYHPADDWRWWKAQLWQESRLDPNARSPVGAEGIAQFMPRTATQYGLMDRRMAEPSIYAGARMMRDLTRFWSAPRTATSRRRLAQASYNAGAGNLLKAQHKCGGNEWEMISPCLREVTGRYSLETLTYVTRIERWYRAMVA